VFDPALHISLECQVTRHVVDLLRREQLALQQADISAVDPLIQEKTYQLQQLAQLADARKQWIATLGHGLDREGTEKAFRDCPDAAAAWMELIDLAKTAVQINKINGLIIDRHLRHNQRILRELRTATRATALYGSDGQHRPISPVRQLGEG
jgi:flagella synthesis protein FlgN